MAPPTLFNREIAEQICEIIATSSKGLREVSKDVKVSVRAIMNWLHDGAQDECIDSDKKMFVQQYARAKKEQAHFLVEEMIEIADESTNDTIYTDKGEMPNNEWINRSRLRVETRKWLAGKLLPKVYGDKLDLEIQAKVINVVVEPEDEDE